MSHFERTEGAEDNLGNNPISFVPIEEMEDSSAESPDEILARKEEDEFTQQNVIDLDDIDTESSNWEADVESGKYDDFETQEEPLKKDFIGNPVLLKDRQNIVRIEEMKGREQLEKYWDVSSQKVDNSKPKRPEDNRESIRLNKSV